MTAGREIRYDKNWLKERWLPKGKILPLSKTDSVFKRVRKPSQLLIIVDRVNKHNLSDNPFLKELELDVLLT